MKIGDTFTHNGYKNTIIEFIEDFKGYGPVVVLKREDDIIYRLQPDLVKKRFETEGKGHENKS